MYWSQRLASRCQSAPAGGMARASRPGAHNLPPRARHRTTFPKATQTAEASTPRRGHESVRSRPVTPRAAGPRPCPALAAHLILSAMMAVHLKLPQRTRYEFEGTHAARPANRMHRRRG